MTDAFWGINDEMASDKCHTNPLGGAREHGVRVQQGEAGGGTAFYTLSLNYFLET